MAGHVVRTVRQRFGAKWALAENGCWLWTDVPSANGYGYLGVGGRSGRKVQAHKLAYEFFIGPVPAGTWIDHTCHNRDLYCPGGNACQHRRCVNPKHLEAVPPRVNLLRSDKTINSRHASVMTCSQGHPYDSENTCWYKGHRLCRQCRRNRQRKIA